MVAYRRHTVPFVLLSPDAKLRFVEATGPETIRLWFKDPITANVGNPLGGVVFHGPSGTNPVDLNIDAAGPDWIDVDTLGTQFNHVQMLGPVTNLFGESGEVATGYGMAVTRTGIVNVTIAQLNLVPDEIRYSFDHDLLLCNPPYIFQARSPGGVWRTQAIKSGTGADWQEFLWIWGIPLPTEWRIVTYPTGMVWVDGYLDVPADGLVLPIPGGKISSVQVQVPNTYSWEWAEADLIGVVGVPTEPQMYSVPTGWVSPTAVGGWGADFTLFTFPLLGNPATLWRLNAQVTGHTFLGGSLEMPQNGVPFH